MTRRLASVLAVVLVCRGAFASEAENRGSLSLAWDAHESGLCEEVLGYAAAIPSDSPLAPEGVWLRVDCLRTLGRFSEALTLLEAPGARSARDWAGLVSGVVEDWVWEKTSRGEYAEALPLVARGLAALPDEPSLRVLSRATLFRAQVERSVGRTGVGRLPGGEGVFVGKGRPPQGGADWIRAFPWKGETFWVPALTPEDWMPSRARRLEREGKTLWVRVGAAALDRALSAEARSRGLSLRAERDGFRLRLGDEEMFGDREEWQMRAAVEGLGVRGAAVEAVADAVSVLTARKALSKWVGQHLGALVLAKEGALARLSHPVTGRTYDLDLDSWAPSYDPDSKEWTDFWDDLTTELGREPGAFRCFCGREAVVREVLTHEPGAASVVVEKGKGYSVVLTALCPLHQQPVTPDLLRQWGVSRQQVWDRAKKDAAERPWALAFERGEEGGTPYLALQGEGASSLARRPELLLGALEAVEGSEARGSVVQVLAPTSSSLVVLSGRVPPAQAQAAATRVLLRGARRGEPGERLGYRATLHLPPKATGLFEVHAADGP